MKSLLIVFCFLAFLGTTAYSQELSKEEAKELKKKLKSMTPEQLQELEQQNTAYYEQLQEKESTINELQAENAQLMSEVDKLKEAKEAKQTEQENSEDNYADNYETPTAKGVLFKVQIGAFKELDLREFFGNNENFSGEVEEDGTMKYTLGTFTDYWQADKFKKYLRKMGVKDAWIVAYKDGKRVDIKDALEGAI